MKNKMKLYTYIVAHDFGLAPNPFWDELTLNVCKPKIRVTAEEGDWIIGTGSKNVSAQNGERIDYSGRLVYAMKVTRKMTMKEYDIYCKNNLQKKIPYLNRKDWRIIVGDSIYDFSQGETPRIRKLLHTEKNRDTDLSGKYTLTSTEFYYFGSNAEYFKDEFPELMKDPNKNPRGHNIITDKLLISKFQSWLQNKFELKKLYGYPQLKWKLDDGLKGKCDIECDE